MKSGHEWVNTDKPQVDPCLSPPGPEAVVEVVVVVVEIDRPEVIYSNYSGYLRPIQQPVFISPIL